MFFELFRRLVFGLGLLLATHVLSQTTAAPSERVMALVESRCGICHGKEGESASAFYPRLAAQHPDYLNKQLRDFRDGKRISDTMNDMVKDLQDDDFKGLAAWFASRNPGSRRTAEADLAAVGKYIFSAGNPFSGVPACASCHGSNGYGTQQLPRLAGQHPSYLERQLKEFDSRTRTNDNAIMHSIASKLTALETRAVSVYLGSLQ